MQPVCTFHYACVQGLFYSAPSIRLARSLVSAYSFSLLSTSPVLAFMGSRLRLFHGKSFPWRTKFFPDWLGVYMQPVCTLYKRAHASRVHLSLLLRLGFVILCIFYSLSTFTRVGFVFLLLLST